MNEVRTMTDVAWQEFVDGGCEPECHVCGAHLPEGDRYVMRQPFEAQTKDEHTVTLEVMVCYACRHKALPDNQYERARELMVLALQKSTSRTPESVTPDYPSPFYPGRSRGGCFMVNGRIVPNG